MKNIHILPTNKPSRLFIDKNILILDNEYLPNIPSDGQNQNIYITSDEEIKEGDWMIRDNEQPTLVTPNFFWDFGVRYYKIILTTDQDLIRDGVQAIDDEFLEWFVENPSCQEVEVYEELNQEKLLGKTISKKDADKNSFEDVTNYITEKMYSEEEVLNIIDNYNETFKVDLILREDFNQWFEQFKSK